MRRLISTTIVCLFLMLNSAQAQYQILPQEGYSAQISSVVSMLEDLKARVTSSVKDLDQESADFLLDENSNRIGALILHLAATEKYYQVYTFEGREFNEEEKEKWEVALSLGDKAREELVGQPISYYLEIWDEVRKETLRLLKTKNDKWFAKEITEGGMNNHYAWYHVMEHQANHMGQIRYFIKRIPKDETE